MALYRCSSPSGGGGGSNYYAKYQDGTDFDATTKKLTVGFRPKGVMIKCGLGAGEMMVIYDADQEPNKYVQFNANNNPNWFTLGNDYIGIRSIENDGVVISDSFYSSYVSKTSGSNRPQYIMVYG